MFASFVELPPFERVRQTYLDHGSYLRLQEELLADPAAGDVIEGTGGLRKLRCRTPGAARERVGAYG